MMAYFINHDSDKMWAHFATYSNQRAVVFAQTFMLMCQTYTIKPWREKSRKKVGSATT